MSESRSVPNVLVIPDGNRRWARENGTDYVTAYERAIGRMLAAAQHLSKMGAHDVWFPVTRPFNRKRDPEELNKIFHACTLLYDLGHKQDSPVNVRVDGDITHIPANCIEQLKRQEAQTQPGLITVHIVFDWSTETEVVDLFRYGQENSNALTGLEDLRRLSVIDQQIDLIIRTGLLRGENIGRLSGFIPWHSTDADLVFPPKLFPDFTTNDLDMALNAYYSPEHKNRIAV